MDNSISNLNLDIISEPGNSSGNPIDYEAFSEALKAAGLPRSKIRELCRASKSEEGHLTPRSFRTLLEALQNTVTISDEKASFLGP